MKPLVLTLSGFITYRDRVQIDFQRFESGLFIISGPTGSGKSTIFDAISYALYGKVSSSRRSASDDSELRCQYLSEDDPETYVDLTFIASGMHWRIVRKPAQTLQSTLKVRTFPSEAKLYRRHQGNWESVSEKIKEIEAYIEDVVGLSHEQFTKIVLLPQGEFTAFLSSTSKNKTEILRRIFGTQSILAFEERVKSETFELVHQSKNASEKINDAVSYLSDDLKLKLAEWIVDDRLDPTHYQAFSQVLSKSLKEKDKQLIPLKEKINVFNTMVSQAKIELDQAVRSNQMLSAFRSTEAALADLQKQVPEMTNLRKALEKIKLWDKDHLIRERKIEADKTLRIKQEAMMQARDGFNQAKASLEELRAPYEALPTAKSRLLEERNRLLSLRKEYDTRLQVERDLKEIQVQKETFHKLQERIVILEHNLLKREEVLSGIGDTGSQLNYLYERYRQVQILLNDLDKRNNHLLQFARLSESIQSRLNKIELCQRDLEGVRKELSEISRKRSALDQEIQKQGLAAFRHLLVENEACPFCGSKDHPHPICEGDSQLTTQEKELEETFNSLQKDLLAGINLIKSNQEEICSEESQLDQMKIALQSDSALSRKHASLLDIYPNHLNSSAFWEIDTDSLSYQKQLSECHKLQESYLVLLKYITEQGQACRERDTEAKSIQKAYDAEKTLLQEERIQFKSLETRIIMKEQEIANHRETNLDIEALEKTLKSLKQKIDDEDLRIQKIEEAHKKALIAYAGAESRLDSLNSVLSEAQAAFDMAARQWDQILRKQGITDQVFLEEGLALEGVRGKEGLVKDFDQKMASQEGVYQSQKEMVKGLVEKDLQELNERIRLFEDQWQEYNHHYLQIREQYAQDRQQGESIQKSMKTFGGLLQKRDQLQQFDRILRGQGGLNNGLDRLDFETYVLIYYFENMLRYANARLYRMTDGQYELVRRTELGKQGRQGLDIDVIDIHTGKQRSSATLSGGESFLASLALALGLSDELTSRSGGRAIETLFIDEGFGSLDSDTLQKATEVLMDLTENNRLIGLISHVEDLVEIIPNRIEVIYAKDKGSHIQITTG